MPAAKMIDNVLSARGIGKNENLVRGFVESKITIILLRRTSNPILPHRFHRHVGDLRFHRVGDFGPIRHRDLLPFSAHGAHLGSCCTWENNEWWGAGSRTRRNISTLSARGQEPYWAP